MSNRFRTKRERNARSKLHVGNCMTCGKETWYLKHPLCDACLAKATNNLTIKTGTVK